jgi:isocitrate dehydrogenase kinase/phosphatase
VIFRRRARRFDDLIERQLDLFEREHADVVAEAEERLRLYNEADREEAEELYGDYVDAVETGTEILADLRDHFARTLDEDAAEEYERAFHAAVARRLRPFALEIDNR